MGKPLTERFPFFYGWVIVGVSFIITLVAYGVWWSFPVFYIAILDEFGWSRAETATIFTVGSIVFGGSSVLAGVLFDKVGPRKLVPIAGIVLAIGCIISSFSDQIWHFLIAYGIFMGAGTICAGWVPIATVVSNWFDRRRGTALSIALVGDVGAPVVVVLIQLLIATTGWRTSYLILAAVVLVTILPLAGIFMRTRPEDVGLEIDGGSITKDSEPQKKAKKAAYNLEVVNKEWVETEWTFCTSVRTYQFWLLFGMVLTVGIGMGIILTHQIASTIDIGYNAMLAASIFGLMGFMAILGRIGGFISDRIGREITATIFAILITLGLLSLLMAGYYTQIFFLYFYAVLFGIGLGITSPVMGSTAADIFGGKNFGSILGFINIGFGLGIGLGAWLGGAVYDLTGSYNFAFSSAIIAFLIMCATIWLAAPRKVRRVVKTRLHES